MLVSGRVESIIYEKQWDFRLDGTDALPFDVRSPLPKSTLQPLAALVLFGDNNVRGEEVHIHMRSGIGI